MKRYGDSVLLLYNAPQTDAESERGILDEVAAVESALTRLHIPFVKAGIEALDDLPGLLTTCTARLVVNLVEGFPVHSEDANLVPAVCRAFGRGVTGNDTPALALGLDKAVAKSVLASAGLPVAAGRIVAPGQPVFDDLMPPGPVIVKPARTDGSEGIDARSVGVWPDPALRAAVLRVHETFHHPALIEAFCGTREFNLSILQDGDDLRLMPVAEIEFRDFGPDRPRIVSYEAKWNPEAFEFRNTVRVLPANLPKARAARLGACALDAWRALGCRDYARVDIRMDEDGALTVIEVNPNPDIAPEAGFAKALEAGGVAYDDFVSILLRNASRRLGVAEPAATPAVVPPLHAASQAIRRSEAKDRERVLDLVRKTGFFRPDEVEVAREVLDDALKDGPGGHYQSFVIEVDGTVAGWVCCGPTPCTIGTWDIYWIAVDPDFQKRSLGRALLHQAEACIRERGGKLAVLETSGREEYQPTRGFYLKCGYEEAAVLRDYYGPGDALVIFTRHL